MLTKFHIKKMQKPCQVAGPKNVRRKCFCFTGEICLDEISLVHRKQDFSLFWLMVEFSPSHFFLSLKFFIFLKILLDIALDSRRSHQLSALNTNLIASLKAFRQHLNTD
jgi:hypothetical protein